MKTQLQFIVIVFLISRISVWAQHEHHQPARPDTTKNDRHKNGMANSMHAEMMGMSNALLPKVSMQRDGSGTSWLTDSAPVHGIHERASAWHLMLHGNATFRYTAQDAFDKGERGDSRFDAPNWFMVMAQRELGTNRQLTLRGMLSLDPLTIGDEGYPLLLQTGETFEGRPLIDRQHPHDLFMELAAIYGQSFNDKTGFFGYFGLPGEPALGPVAFMHRPSTRHNPSAPLSHHWQDATHITFGVGTLGLRYGMFKLDGSIFTGREPDEERFGFDKPRFDSYSVRLSANPNARLSLQASRGFLKSPETLEPEEDQRRTTASLIYNRNGDWATTLIWGMNEPAEESVSDEGHKTQHAVLLESDFQPGKQAVYSRIEWVEKSASELGLEQFGNRNFGIWAFTLGAAREIATFDKLMLAVGAQGSLNRVANPIQFEYGRRPVSFEVYFMVSPPRMRMEHAGMNR